MAKSLKLCLKTVKLWLVNHSTVETLYDEWRSFISYHYIKNLLLPSWHGKKTTGALHTYRVCQKKWPNLFLSNLNWIW